MDMIRYDIGLVYRSNHNYGANLTHYALANYLLKQNNSILLIDMPSGLALSLPLDRDDPFELFGCNPYIFINSLEDIDQHNLGEKAIYVWRAKHIWELDKANELCQMFLVGSDQLWRSYFLVGSGHYSLLGWVAEGKYRASYSTSFGTDSFEGDDIEIRTVGNLLGEFNRISIREKSGVQIVNNLSGVKAKWVVDPVFLLGEEDYSKLIINDNNEYNIGFYILDFTDSKICFLERQIEIYNYSCAGYTDAMVQKTMDDKLAKYLLISKTVESWITMIKKSKFVITDSFHGMCFAIIFHKPFVVIADENIQRGFTRIQELLNRLGLENHIVSNEELNNVCLEDYEDINYKVIDRILNNCINESKMWLNETVSEGLATECNSIRCNDCWNKFSESKYLEHMRKRNSISNIISDRFSCCEKYVIWGTGNIFSEYSSAVIEETSPIYVVDNNKDKWGKIYCNYLECKSPECLYTEDVVVIILVESEYVSNSIINQLKKYNIGKYITYSEISEKR